MNASFKQPILPPATIGIVGGGQLGQMMTLSAKAMGYQVGVLDPTPKAPAAQVADFQIVAAYDDEAALLDLARRSDVLTYEFENVDETALKAAQAYAQLPQGTELLHITGDRLNEKQFLHDHGIPVTPFAPVNDRQSLNYALNRVGTPAILKTAAGGYDGHGQADLASTTITPEAEALLAHPCILEARQEFQTEVSMMVTRSAADVVTTFPLVENQHQHHILHTTIAPANVQASVHAAARKIAVSIAEALEFEAHIRSICGLPIPAVVQTSPAVMRNLLGDDLTLVRQQLINHPEWHFHDYGKAAIKSQRKMGHVTVLNHNIDAALASVSILKGEQ